jgi:hypothetical protein
MSEPLHRIVPYERQCAKSDNLTDIFIEKSKKKHGDKYDYYKSMLNEFYWPFYLKLLCIHQLNYSIPIKNEYEYISDEEIESDDSANDNANIKISINVERDIILDKQTIELLESNLDLLFKEALDILEKNIYRSSSIDKQFVQFIKYCKIRFIIKEGSINHKYNMGFLYNVDTNKHSFLGQLQFPILIIH